MGEKVRLDVDFCRIRLSNPTVLASGILGVSKESLARVVDNGAGAVTIKSISKEPIKGHNNPTIIVDGSYMLNAVGYSNPGMAEARKEFSDLRNVRAPIFASVIGKEAKDFAEVAEYICPDRRSGFSAVEIPLSCPHTPGYGTMAGQATPEKIYEITAAVKDATRLPIIIKLSPSTEQLGNAAKAAEGAGADAICMGNSLGPGMRIDIPTRTSLPGFGFGGVTGPAILPIMTRCVYDVYKAVKIPIIGTGGITYGKDAVQMIMAGSTLAGAGTAVYYRGIDVFRKISNEIGDIMKEEGYSRIKDMIGAAHG